MSHLNVLLPRVRSEDSPDEPDNRIRNLVLAIIFSIFGAIAIAVALYLGISYYRQHKRNQQRRLDKIQRQSMAKIEDGQDTPPQYGGGHVQGTPEVRY